MIGRTASLLVIASLVLALVVGAASLLPPARGATASSTVSGSIGGPQLLGENSHATYFVNGTGGPAIAPNGTLIGNLTYFASVHGPSTTGVLFTPAQNGIVNGAAPRATLTVTVPETLTIAVMVSSIYHGANASINFTYVVTVVQPYLVAATIVDTSTTSVLSFPVAIELDGSYVGNVTVPPLTSGQKYQLQFPYVTLGLSAGTHTFSISLENEHGLVTFANGATVYSQSIYVPGPATDYTVWYIAGAIAFFGAIFIFVTRVAARRRGATRR